MLLRQLEYLVALARTRHFARAAEACYISQPALSAAIRKLEAELQVLIVSRGNRFMGFTPEGERVVEWAYRLLAERDAFVQDVNAMRGDLSGCLKIGAIPTTLSVVSALTTPFTRKYPRTRVSIMSMSSNDIQRGLDEYEIDIGMTYIDNEPLAHVRVTPLYREQYVLLTPDDERFAGRTSATWAEVAQLPLCLLTPDMQNRRIVNDALRQSGAEPAPTIETNSVTALASHVRYGGWSAVMADTWLVPFGMPQRMHALPLVEPEVNKGVGLVVHEREPEPILAQAFVDVAQTVDLEQELAEIRGS